jgi:hypothetical protein
MITARLGLSRGLWLRAQSVNLGGNNSKCGQRVWDRGLLRETSARDIDALQLRDEPDRHWVKIEFSVAGLDGGDDDEDGVQDLKGSRKRSRRGAVNPESRPRRASPGG